MAIIQRRITIPFIALGLLLGPRAALAQGTLLWQQTLNGTANIFDVASSVAVDTEGNVLAAGSTWNTSTDNDFTVAKFAGDGTLLWQRTLNGTANDNDVADSVAVDTEGNVLAAGSTQNTGTGVDFTVVKFARDGTLLWRQTLNGTANSFDVASSVAVDTEGNVLAAGYTENTGTSADFTVVKFAADGTLLWQWTLNGTANDNDVADSVAVDTEGNVLAGGSMQNTATGSGFTVVKFARDGTVRWQQTLGGGLSSVAVDTEGNVLAAGGTQNDFTVAKFARDGTLLWQQTLNGTANGGRDFARSVAVDTEGNVLAAGYTDNTGTFTDFTVVKFAAAGTLLWRHTLTGTANTSFDDMASSVAVDTQDNVLAAGYTVNTGTSADFSVVKFAPDGTLLWRQSLNGTATPGDQARSVAVDREGNVLAAGYTNNTGTDIDFTVAKFAGMDDTPWNFCAPEGGLCAFTGTTEVRYGANGAYVYLTLTDGTACNNAVFGDPVYGTRKSCAIRILPAPTEWTGCAAEGGQCPFSGTREVRYGANGAYVFLTLTDGKACNNAVFGDPIYGTVKACAIRVPPDPTEWTFCAAEGGECAFTGAREVRYGANGVFVYQTLANGTACSNFIFGDPLYGVVKSCSLRTASGSSLTSR